MELLPETIKLMRANRTGKEPGKVLEKHGRLCRGERTKTLSALGLGKQLTVPQAVSLSHSGMAHSDPNDGSENTAKRQPYNKRKKKKNLNSVLKGKEKNTNI